EGAEPVHVVPGGTQHHHVEAAPGHALVVPGADLHPRAARGQRVQQGRQVRVAVERGDGGGQRDAGWAAHGAVVRGNGGRGSEVLVVGPGAALRRHPVDDRVRVLDVAGLAVHAVGGVDLQPAAGGVLDHLVDAGRAEAGAGVAVLDRAAFDADRGVVHHQVHRLVLVVFGGGEVDA